MSEDLVRYKTTKSQPFVWSIVEGDRGRMDEKRVRYTKSHYKSDVEMVREFWPISGTEFVSVDDVTPKIRKKFQRVIKTHWSYWSSLQNDWHKHIRAVYSDSSAAPTAANFDTLRQLTDRAIDSILRAIPKVDGKMVVDAPENIREGQCAQKSKMYTRFLKSAFLYGVSIRSSYLKDATSTITFATKILSTFPPLSDRSPIPSAVEIRGLLAMVQVKTHFLTSLPVLCEARCCAAAMRLLEHDYYRGSLDENTIESCRFSL